MTTYVDCDHGSAVVVEYGSPVMVLAGVVVGGAVVVTVVVAVVGVSV